MIHFCHFCHHLTHQNDKTSCHYSIGTTLYNNRESKSTQMNEVSGDKSDNCSRMFKVTTQVTTNEGDVRTTPVQRRRNPLDGPDSCAVRACRVCSGNV